MPEETLEIVSNDKERKSALYYIGVVLTILGSILTAYSYIALFSRLLSFIVVLVVGIIMLAILIIITVLSLGFIYMTPFGTGFFNAFKAVWRGQAIDNITNILFMSLPYTIAFGLAFSIVSTICLIISKKKSTKHLVFSIISTVLLILLLILRLYIGVI